MISWVRWSFVFQYLRTQLVVSNQCSYIVIGYWTTNECTWVYLTNSIIIAYFPKNETHDGLSLVLK